MVSEMKSEMGWMRTLVGVSACIAFAYCLFINSIHIYLTRTSKQRQPIFYRRILPFSHLSMLLMLLGTLSIIFSYFHPELLFDNCSNYCVNFYIIAVICYVGAMYLLKTAYLVRLNMVINPTNVNQWSLSIQIYLVMFVISCIALCIVQGLVITGTSFSNSNVNSINNFGCVITFSSWNGWIACTIMGIDALRLYFYVASYYSNHISPITQPQVIKNGGDISLSNLKSKPQMIKIKVQEKIKLKIKRTTIQRARSNSEPDVCQTPDQITTIPLTTIATATAITTTPKATANDQDIPESTNIKQSWKKEANLSEINMDNTKMSRPENIENNANTENTKLKKTLKAGIENNDTREADLKRSLKIYHGLRRQFIVTIIALMTGMIDLMINTLLQNYNMTWLLMIDICVNVTCNLAGFSDGKHTLINIYKYIMCCKCCQCWFCQVLCPNLIQTYCIPGGCSQCCCKCCHFRDCCYNDYDNDCSDNNIDINTDKDKINNYNINGDGKNDNKKYSRQGQIKKMRKTPKHKNMRRKSQRHGYGARNSQPERKKREKLDNPDTYQKNGKKRNKYDGKHRQERKKKRNQENYNVDGDPDTVHEQDTDGDLSDMFGSQVMFELQRT